MKKMLLQAINLKMIMLLLFFVSAAERTVAQSGNYIEFDGTNKYMQIPHHPDFNFSTSQEYTISFWMNANAFTSNARMVAKRDMNASNKSGYELFGTSSSSNFYALNTPNPAGTNVFSQWGTIAGSTGTWIHLAFVVSRNGGTTTIYQYQNGQVAKQSTNNPSSYEVTNSLDILVGKALSGFFLNAKMDNLRFYNTALSQSQVQADMTASVSTSTQNLVAAYDFENLSSATVIDIKGNHNATLVNFPQAPSNSGVSVTQETNFTGRGNDNEVILKTQVTSSSTRPLNELVLSMNGTTSISDVETIKVYSTGLNATFDSRNPSNATLIGSASPSASDINIPLSGNLSSGTNYLWITYQVSATATEGNKLDAELKSIRYSNNTYTLSNGAPFGSREILLRRKLLFAPGDAGSSNYRIPAIITANDGTLITLTDKRKFNSGDLPGDIDIICSRSTDGGATWSNPITVAQGTGQGAGFGDAVLMKAQSGKLIALFVGGPGLWSSTPSNPIRSYVSTSSDNGLSWSSPVDITSSIFGAGAPFPRSNWYASFFGSGQGLTLSSGRVMAVAAIRETNANNTLNNYVVYSDDEGATWNISNRAIAGGDEAKVVQLNNGDVLMSSRNSTRIWAKSTDGGINWGTQSSWSQLTGNPTNGDMVRYTSTNDGFEQNRILHTIPYNSSQRENVSMFVSYDEGGTWPVNKTLDAGASAYSSITILPDNTIGVYLEEDNGNGFYDMYFLNFTLEWLTNGNDALSTSPPVANFTFPSAIEGQAVSFTNTSTGANTYSWTFESGTPASSNDENPTIVFSQPGTFNVSLTVTNSNGSNSITKQIVVAQVDVSQDIDGDGVLNDNDLDDDNDGILDTDECDNVSVQSFSNGTGGGTHQASKANTERVVIDFYTLDNSASIKVNGTAIDKIFETERGVFNSSTEVMIKFSSGDYSTPWLANNNSLPRLRVTINEEGNITLEGTRYTSSNSLEPVIRESSNALPTISYGSNTTIEITNPNDNGPDGITGEIKMYGTCDTDGDGILNAQDLDSDNDGCVDALEGGAGLAYNQVVVASGNVTSGIGSTAGNLNLGVSVDQNGVPSIVSGGQTTGTAYNASQQNSNCSPPDEVAPTAPTALAANDITYNAFNLSWSAANDNIAVTGYKVYRDGSLVATVPSTSAAITGLSELTTYSMQVSAIDAAGNESTKSQALSVTTIAAPVDMPPTVPTNLQASAITTNSLNLSWSASTDDNSVAGYTVYQDGTVLQNTTATSLAITGLTAASTYNYSVLAYDNAGNQSAQSQTTTVTTLAEPSCVDIRVDILTDRYGYETSWVLKNAAGTTVMQGNNYRSSRPYSAVECLPAGCYTFTIYDSYGDGICCAYGNGYYRIYVDGQQVEQGGAFRSNETKQVCTSGQSLTQSTNSLALPIQKHEADFVDIYPNPANSHIQITGPLGTDYSIYDINGQQVLSGQTSKDVLDLSKLETGVYLVKITIDGKKTITKKLIKH